MIFSGIDFLKKIGNLQMPGALLVLAVLPSMLAAQDYGSDHLDTGAQKMMKPGDAAFALKAAQGGVAEVRLGQLALKKANHSDVKAFGQRMVDDHSKTNERLKAAAAKSGMTLPATMNADDQALYDKLSRLSGAAFDRAYTRAMVKDHEQDIKEFQREAAKGTNADIRAFAEATLPTLQVHLEMARAAERKASASGSE
jgi:putative membrane protein